MIPSRTFTVAELADLLQLPVNFVDTKARGGEWEHQRFGRTVRFTEDQVATLLAKTRKAPAEDTSRAAQFIALGVDPRSARRYSRRSA